MSKTDTYPKTPHLPDSPGATETDIFMDPSAFVGQDVVVTEKMDGQLGVMRHDRYHTKSLNPRHHPSQSWVKRLYSQIRHDIPKGWRICGENLYATHSLHYEDLPSYYMVFSVWDHRTVLSWEETVEWCEKWGLEHVPVLWQGTWDRDTVLSLRDQIDTDAQEGFVVRTADAFEVDEFHANIAKWVRPDHIQTDDNWRHQPVRPNELADDADPFPS